MAMIQTVLKKAKSINPPLLRDYRSLLVNFRQNLGQSFPFFYKFKEKIWPFSIKLGIFRRGSLCQTSVGLKKGFEKSELRLAFPFNSKVGLKSDILKRP
ncbi:MAG: hypothetical protein LBP71_02995 [Spirochaetaceae bacterium]|jgi:hypothetical protein|nr:hypothetical protein [Spirochaetaceae bacterium]